MKIGNLVKIKRPGVIATSSPMNNLGIVIEVLENACKVMFPCANGLIKCFMKSSLEIIE